MIIYFGQKCRGAYYFENILTIILLLINEIQIFFLYYTRQELQFDHDFIILKGVGPTVIIIWTFYMVILLLWGVLVGLLYCY